MENLNGSTTVGELRDDPTIISELDRMNVDQQLEFNDHSSSPTHHLRPITVTTTPQPGPSRTQQQSAKARRSRIRRAKFGKILPPRARCHRNNSPGITRILIKWVQRSVELHQETVNLLKEIHALLFELNSTVKTRINNKTS